MPFDGSRPARANVRWTLETAVALAVARMTIYKGSIIAELRICPRNVFTARPKRGRSCHGASICSTGLCLRALGLVPDIDLTLRGLKIGWVVRIKKPSRMVARFFQGRQFTHIALVGNGCLVPDLGQVAAFRGTKVCPRACLHAPRGTCSEQEHY